MIVRALYALLTLAVSGVALWMAHRLRSDRLRTDAWPTTLGKITRRGTAAMDAVAQAAQAQLTYVYEVDGKSYEGNRVYPTGHVGALPDKMQRFVASLPAQLPVHYDPAAPGESYLFPNPQSTSWLLLAIGVAAALATLAQVLMLAVGKG